MKCVNVSSEKIKLIDLIQAQVTINYQHLNNIKHIYTHTFSNHFPYITLYMTVINGVKFKRKRS